MKRVVVIPVILALIALLLAGCTGLSAGTAVLRLVFGVTPQQRVQPVVEALAEAKIKPQTSKIAAAAGVTAALAAIIFSLWRGRK